MGSPKASILIARWESPWFPPFEKHERWWQPSLVGDLGVRQPPAAV